MPRSGAADEPIDASSVGAERSEISAVAEDQQESDCATYDGSLSPDRDEEEGTNGMDQEEQQCEREEGDEVEVDGILIEAFTSLVRASKGSNDEVDGMRIETFSDPPPSETQGDGAGGSDSDGNIQENSHFEDDLKREEEQDGDYVQKPPLKRRKLHRDDADVADLKDLSDVPTNLPPIPADRPGVASRFKGVRKRAGKGRKNRWLTSIRIDGNEIFLGSFDSEEAAGVMYARACFKIGRTQQIPQSDQTVIDLNGVPTNIAPVPSRNPKQTTSKYKGVVLTKHGKWEAQIRTIEAGLLYLGRFESEEEAGIMYARARWKYGAKDRVNQRLRTLEDLRDVPMNIPPVPAVRVGASSKYKGVAKVQGGKWLAQMHFRNGPHVKLGTFDSEKEAAVTYARYFHKYGKSSK